MAEARNEKYNAINKNYGFSWDRIILKLSNTVEIIVYYNTDLMVKFEIVCFNLLTYFYIGLEHESPI